MTFVCLWSCAFVNESSTLACEMESSGSIDFKGHPVFQEYAGNDEKERYIQCLQVRHGSFDFESGPVFQD
jgi:hypothetical protein